MNMLLFSDSHGFTQAMARAVKKHKDCEMVIHLGDCTADARKLGEQFPGMRLEIVSGNNDWSRDYPAEKVLEIEGKKIFITHGHAYNVKNDYQRIILRGKAAAADAVFFGHTHQPEELFSDGMLVLNPGSIGRARPGTNSTYCLITIREGRIIPRFCGLG